MNGRENGQHADRNMPSTAEELADGIHLGFQFHPFTMLGRCADTGAWTGPTQPTVTPSTDLRGCWRYTDR